MQVFSGVQVTTDNLVQKSLSSSVFKFFRKAERMRLLAVNDTPIVDFVGSPCIYEISKSLAFKGVVSEYCKRRLQQLLFSRPTLHAIDLKFSSIGYQEMSPGGSLCGP